MPRFNNQEQRDFYNKHKHLYDAIRKVPDKQEFANVTVSLNIDEYVLQLLDKEGIDIRWVNNMKITPSEDIKFREMAKEYSEKYGDIDKPRPFHHILLTKIHQFSWQNIESKIKIAMPTCASIAGLVSIKAMRYKVITYYLRNIKGLSQEEINKEHYILKNYGGIIHGIKYKGRRKTLQKWDFVNDKPRFIMAERATVENRNYHWNNSKAIGEITNLEDFFNNLDTKFLENRVADCDKDKIKEDGKKS